MDRVFQIDKKSKSQTRDLLAQVRENEYENLFCPHESFRSAFLCRSIRAKQKIGFKKWWNFWAFNIRVERNLDFADALRQLSLLCPLDMELNDLFGEYMGSHILPQRSLGVPGINNTEAAVPEWASMSFRSHFLQQSSVSENLSQRLSLTAKPFIVISPGSVWATKRWTVEGFRRVAEHFSKNGFHILIMGASNEVEVCQSVAQGIANTHVLAGKTSLYETTHLMTRASAVISNDSGAMHMASVADTPCVAIFGPTVVRLGYRPWQNRSVVVEKNDLQCRPCGLHGHQKCPIGTHDCMKKISHEEVILQAEKLIK